MPRVAYLELMGAESRAYIFEDETGRLMQELSFEYAPDKPIELELPEGVEETIVSVPLAELGIRALDIPIADIKSIRDILPFELEGMILGNPQEMVIDAIPLVSLEKETEEDAKQRVLAIYMENDKLASMLEMFKGAKIDPRAVTSSELAEMVKGLKNGSNLTDMVVGTISLNENERLELARDESTNEPTVNFRMGKFAYTKEEEKTKLMLFKTAALAAALLLALSGHMILKASGLSNSAALINAKSLQIYSELFTGQKPPNTNGLKYKAEAKVKALRDKAELYREADMLGLMMHLQSTNKPGLKLNEITVDNRTVIIKGVAKKLDDVHAFRDDLAGTPDGMLQKVTISESGASATGDTAFTITANKGIE